MDERATLTRGNISVFDDGTYWDVEGTRRKSEDRDSIVLHLDDLKNVSLTQLRSVLRQLEN